MDRKKLYPEAYKKDDSWKEWAEEFVDYIEACNEGLAVELRRAAYYPSEIEGIVGSDEEKKLARQAYSALRRLMKDTEAKMIVKTTPDRNVYEAWRRLNFAFDPQTASVETSAMTKILSPKQAASISKLALKIQKWEDRITEYKAKVGESPINDRTRKELWVQMCPDKLQEHIRDLLLMNKAATWQQVKELIFSKKHVFV